MIHGARELSNTVDYKYGEIFAIGNLNNLLSEVLRKKNYDHLNRYVYFITQK